MIENSMIGGKLFMLTFISLSISFLILSIPLSYQIDAFKPSFKVNFYKILTQNTSKVV